MKRLLNTLDKQQRWTMNDLERRALLEAVHIAIKAETQQSNVLAAVWLKLQEDLS